RFPVRSRSSRTLAQPKSSSRQPTRSSPIQQPNDSHIPVRVKSSSPIPCRSHKRNASRTSPSCPLLPSWPTRYVKSSKMARSLAYLTATPNEFVGSAEECYSGESLPRRGSLTHSVIDEALQTPLCRSAVPAWKIEVHTHFGLLQEESSWLLNTLICQSK